ncbi:MAG: 50S ribosomal protein L21 [Acidimicrobiales bacterium]
MYAVVRSGGKQQRVEAGQRLTVELLGARDGDEVALEPVLVVDGSVVLAQPGQLAGASVKARVLGRALGPKIRGGTYKSKTNQRRRYGHRQQLTELEVLSITGAATPPKARRAAKRTTKGAGSAREAQDAQEAKE